MAQTFSSSCTHAHGSGSMRFTSSFLLPPFDDVTPLLLALMPMRFSSAWSIDHSIAKRFKLLAGQLMGQAHGYVKRVGWSPGVPRHARVCVGGISHSHGLAFARFSLCCTPRALRSHVSHCSKPPERPHFSRLVIRFGLLCPVRRKSRDQ